MVLSAPLLSTLLGLAAALLAFSLLVQVFQEIYKFLTSSKARAYNTALNDFLGPWFSEILRSDALPDLRVRGPFQLKKVSPGREILPLDEKTLVGAVERSAAPWHRRAMDALLLEVELQANGARRSPSPAWRRFLSELGRAERGSPGYHAAREVAAFLEQWGHVPGTAPERGATVLHAPEDFDASAVRTALQDAFLPQLRRVRETIPQLAGNVEYAWRRRNLRQTAVIALLAAFVFDLPIDRLYRTAAALSPAEAVAVAEQALTLHDRSALAGAPSDTLLASADSLLRAALAATGQREGANFVVDASRIRALFAGDVGQDVTRAGSYLLGCLISALLVSFGAPFWHDLTRALLRLQRGPGSPERPTPDDREPAGG